MTHIYCPMIHNGLNVDLKNKTPGYNQCCLSTTELIPIQNKIIDWNQQQLTDIRLQNHNQKWLPGCWQCEKLEKVGIKSFRKAMIEKLGIENNLTGPQRIDLLFDRSCNLACRTCDSYSSTFWIKHLKENSLYFDDYAENSSFENIKKILENLDLSNVRMIQFCGGETLMGNTYWKTAELLAQLLPDAKNSVEIGFQTNGTQTIDPRYYEIIEKFKLVKLLVSIDGVGEKFEYLRWPAVWNQTVDNLFYLREALPSNVMFFVQECTSCLNLYYYDDVRTWVKKNFNANREGDPTDHTTQLAWHKYLNVENITKEYFDAMKNTSMIDAIEKNWRENSDNIKLFIHETEKFDRIRNQNWKKTFPEVAEFYSRYL